MIRRLLAFTLAAALNAGAAQASPGGAAACVDNWRHPWATAIETLETPTCAELAKKPVYERQIAEFNAAKDLLFDIELRVRREPTVHSDAEIFHAIGVVADFVEYALRENEHPELGDQLIIFDKILPEMQRIFQSHNWPQPKDAPGGFRFMGQKILAATPSERLPSMCTVLRQFPA